MTSYGHIALHQWSALPRGEEVLTFALQDHHGLICAEDILGFPEERERRAWMATTLAALTAHTPAVVHYSPEVEDLLFEVAHPQLTSPGSPLTLSPHHRLLRDQTPDPTRPLRASMAALASEATALLAHRKRALRAHAAAHGDTRWFEAFTDGSFDRQHHQGAAGFVRDDGAHGALRFRARTSNEAEFVAALIAVTSARGGEKVSVNTDSRRVVHAMRSLIGLTAGCPTPRAASGSLTELEEATLQALSEVITAGRVRARWVRGHCGNPMNCAADRLAKAMRSRRGRPTVAVAAEIARQATGVSVPLAYGFTADDLAVPRWYSRFLMDGWSDDAGHAREGKIDGPGVPGAGGGARGVVARASA